MQITEFEHPINGGTLYAGRATSSRGRRYMFCATFSGKPCGVFREDPTSELPDGRMFWLQIKAPPALVQAVSKAVKSARTQKMNHDLS